jgi:hypothetical protein
MGFDAQVLEDAERLIGASNERQAKGAADSSSPKSLIREVRITSAFDRSIPAVAESR